jgi:1,2-diacylglycerol 3-alpha-glucosyltransferase
MRILMISDVYFPRINGVSTSIQTFRRELHAAGHETVLIAPEYPAGRAADEPPIIRVPSRYLPRDPEYRLMKLGALRTLRRQLAREAFDLVHIQTPFIAHYQGIAMARALGVPVLESYHTYFEEYLHHYVPLIPRAAMRFVARRFMLWSSRRKRWSARCRTMACVARCT